jgi:outer membrane protein assembly factor BamB
VIALDKATGKEIWKVERPSDGRAECFNSYASATIWTDGTRTLLLSHGNDYCVGHDLKDGSEVWRLGDLNPKGRYNTTLRFVSSPVATPELIVVPTAKQNQLVALKPDAEGELAAGNRFEPWRYPSTPDVCIPLVHDGLVYIVRDGLVDCIDAKTGARQYWSASVREGTAPRRSTPTARFTSQHATAASRCSRRGGSSRNRR